MVLGAEGEPLRVELRTMGGPQLTITMDLVLGGTFAVTVPDDPDDGTDTTEGDPDGSA